METQNSDLSKQMGDKFRLLVQAYNMCMQRVLNKYGLYPGQPLILFSVRDSNTKPTQNELAELLGISKASVGVSLRRLEKNGFIKRIQDKTDTRCNRITLTKKGQEYVHWCEIDFDMIFSTMLEGFKKDDRFKVLLNIETIHKSLSDLKNRLDA